MRLLGFLFCAIFCIILHEVYCASRYIEQDGPHHGHHEGCSGRRMELNSQMKEVRCMPRKSLVSLRPEPGYVYFPHIVSVNRCDGLCGVNLSCMPVESVMKRILTRINHVKSDVQSCYVVHVEEHTRCKCSCKVTEEDCNEHQIYLPDECACKCMNMHKAFQCVLQKGMVWNHEKCKCMCAMEEEECSSGLQWIPALCRCGKVMSTIYDEENNQSLDDTED